MTKSDAGVVETWAAIVASALTWQEARAPQYHEPKWPDDYWPGSLEPPSDAAWTECLALRTVLVAVDHTSYHVGQIVAVRRLLGAWRP